MRSYITISTQCARPGSYEEEIVDTKAFKMSSKGFNDAKKWLTELQTKYEEWGLIKKEEKQNDRQI